MLSEAHSWARDQAIRTFLLGRPDLVRGDPELMRALGVRPDVGNVIDFGPEALSRVTRAHRRESGERRRLEAVARANFEAQAQTHAAALELIGAANLSDLARRLHRLARSRFGLVAAVLAAESEVPDGWRPLAEGQVDLALGDGEPARLGLLPTAIGLFGASAPEVGSVALVRLALPGPRAGLLAFAAGEAEAFAADMGHELIDFLGRVIERLAARAS